MKKYFSDFFQYKMAAIGLLFAFLWGVMEAVLWGRQYWQDSLAVLLILIVLIYDWPKKCAEVVKKERKYRSLGWAFLFVSILLMGVGIHVNMILYKNISVFFAVFGLVVFLDGLFVGGRVIVPFFVAFVILPLYELLVLSLSYPLRLISAMLTSRILQLFGVSISYHGTILYWNAKQVAITDNCSGITLLGVLFFVALLVIRNHKVLFWQKSIWLLLVFLWIIVANISRLLLTALVYAFIGEKALSDHWHLFFGCFFVILASVLIQWSSLLLDSSPEKDNEDCANQEKMDGIDKSINDGVSNETKLKNRTGKGKDS